MPILSSRHRALVEPSRHQAHVEPSRSWRAGRALAGLVSLVGFGLVGFGLVGCGGDAPTYGPCDDVRSCGGADACYRLRFGRSDGSEGDGKLCTRRCASDGDCPNDGVCLALAGDPDATYLCFERCPAEGCFEGLACTPVTGATVEPICLPD